jgi:hypothetical protein
MRHLVGMVAVLVLAGLAFAGSASAQRQPFVASFTSTETEVDPGLSATCGFTVTETDTDIGRFEVFSTAPAPPSAPH